MLIDQRSLWLAATNCYVVAPEPGGPAILIDVPPDIPAVMALLGAHDLSPVALLLTHGHVDHMGGSGGLGSQTGAVAYLHPDDDWLARDPLAQAKAIFGLEPPGDFAPPEAYTNLADGDVLEIAGLSLEVRHTPGHTPGHCCFYMEAEGTLFSGDQLFAGSIGRTDLPGGDFDTLMASMQNRVLDLPDDTAVLPGHGPSTTIARERRTNPFLQGFGG